MTWFGCKVGLHATVITDRGMWGDAGTCLVCGADGYGLRGMLNVPLGKASPEQRAKLAELDARRLEAMP